MDFENIIKETITEQKHQKEEGIAITKYQKGFLDGLLLAHPYTKKEEKPQVLYKDRVIHKEKIKYVDRTIAVERPVIRKTVEYVSRNTDKEYCFWIEELKHLQGNAETFIFIRKKYRHMYLYNKGETQGTITTKYGNEAIGLEELKDFCDFLHTTFPKIKRKPQYLSPDFEQCEDKLVK